MSYTDAWTRHVDKDQKDTFERTLYGSKYILDILHKILTEQLSSLEATEDSLKAYDFPNWRERQAHKNGYRSCLKAVMKLINLDLKDYNERKPTG